MHEGGKSGKIPPPSSQDHADDFGGKVRVSRNGETLNRYDGGEDQRDCRVERTLEGDPNPEEHNKYQTG